MFDWNQVKRTLTEHDKKFVSIIQDSKQFTVETFLATKTNIIASSIVIFKKRVPRIFQNLNSMKVCIRRIKETICMQNYLLVPHLQNPTHKETLNEELLVYSNDVKSPISYEIPTEIPSDLKVDGPSCEDVTLKPGKKIVDGSSGKDFGLEPERNDFFFSLDDTLIIEENLTPPAVLKETQRSEEHSLNLNENCAELNNIISLAKTPVKTPVKTPNSKTKLGRHIGPLPFSKYSPLKREFLKSTPIKTKSLLPHGTRNLCQTKSSENGIDVGIKNSHKNLKFKEGEREVPMMKWKLYFDESGELRKPVFGHYLCSRYLQSINNTCVINVLNTRVNRDGTIITYAKCAHKNCKCFKVICSQKIDKVKIELFSSGLNYYHKPDHKLTRQVRNIERLIHGDSLKLTAPDVYRRQLISKTDSHKIQAGNLDKIKSLNTIAKISSEYKSKDDLDRDDYLDIRNMKIETIVYQQTGKQDKYIPKFGYIQNLTEVPFCVHLYDKDQVEIVKILNNFLKHPVTVHIDATGTVVRKTNKSSKRILYYALVVSIPESVKHAKDWATDDNQDGGTVIPICEMITADHTTHSMYSWLSEFKFFVRGLCDLEWPPFLNIVSDMSYACLNAVAMAWNDHNSIFDYLNMCHKVLSGTEELHQSTVIISLCCSHYTHVGTCSFF